MKDILNKSAQIQRALFSHNKSQQLHPNNDFDMVVEIKRSHINNNNNTIIIVIISSFINCTTVSCRWILLLLYYR